MSSNPRETPRGIARREFYARRRREAAHGVLGETQVYDLLRFSLVQHDGDRQQARLPAEDLLAMQLGATRSAVRGALSRLVEDGSLSRRPRVGGQVLRSYTEQDVGEVIPAEMYRNTDDDQPRIERVGHTILKCPEILKDKVGGDVDEVGMREEVGFAGGETLYFRVSYYVGGTRDINDVFAGVARNLYSRPMNRGKPLPPFREVFERLYDEPFGHSTMTLVAGACDQRTADLLGIPVGSLMLVRERLTYGASGRLFSVCYTHLRGDRVAIVYDDAHDAHDGHLSRVIVTGAGSDRSNAGETKSAKPQPRTDVTHRTRSA